VAKLLLDEDIKARSLVRLLVTQGHDVATTQDRMLDGQPDDAVLMLAAEEGRILLTYNCDDFRHLHEQGQSHAGIGLVYQEPGKSMSYTQIARALTNL
jgi:predicted nuclease of predicted toxin-antitoxin system